MILLRLVASGFRFMAHRHLENSSLVKGIVVGTTALVTGETLLYPESKDTNLWRRDDRAVLQTLVL